MAFGSAIHKRLNVYHMALMVLVCMESIKSSKNPFEGAVVYLRDTQVIKDQAR